MADLQWPPRELARLTLAQLVCLTREKPPSRGPSFDHSTPAGTAAWEAMLAERRRREESW